MREHSKRHREKSITRNSGFSIYPPTSFENDTSVPRAKLRKSMPSPIFSRAVTQTCADPYNLLTISIYKDVKLENCNLAFNSSFFKY